MSEKPGNVIEALSAVMAELPGIGKDSKAAPQQGGYSYRGIEAITREAQPLFAKHGVVFVPRVVSYEIRDIVVNDKPWTDTVALVEYDVYGPGGPEDKITVGPLLAIGRDNSDKGGNKVATQAFKYALTQALCIADAKDDADQGSPEADKTGSAPKAAAEPSGPAALATHPQIAKIVGASERREVGEVVMRALIKAKWKVGHERELTKAQASEFIDWLEKSDDDTIDAAVKKVQPEEATG